ncbi:hypothetical protein DL96DRAFT_1717988 [Flagelloscypha sp. PMI_526]|nr:hypothetical protein DL96DRAFT_1717988 [Flagelloscypha sp. PMI_526]
MRLSDTPRSSRSPSLSIPSPPPPRRHNFAHRFNPFGPPITPILPPRDLLGILPPHKPHTPAGSPAHKSDPHGPLAAPAPSLLVTCLTLFCLIIHVHPLVLQLLALTLVVRLSFHLFLLITFLATFHLIIFTQPLVPLLHYLALVSAVLSFQLRIPVVFLILSHLITLTLLLVLRLRHLQSGLGSSPTVPPSSSPQLSYTRRLRQIRELPPLPTLGSHPTGSTLGKRKAHCQDLYRVQPSNLPPPIHPIIAQPIFPISSHQSLLLAGNVDEEAKHKSKLITHSKLYAPYGNHSACFSTAESIVISTSTHAFISATTKFCYFYPPQFIE